MPNFNWELYSDNSWVNRYPSWVAGYSTWLRQPELEDPRWRNEFLPRLYLANIFAQPSDCRLFISYRRADKDLALRVAEIACQEGFEYWLDILDPDLKKQKNPVATAGLIEMALLDCTHVIALITPNTPGTMWVPYEYGRVKNYKIFSTQAGCWIHPNMRKKNIPEYLYLGTINNSEKEIRQWLQQEKKKYYCVQKTCKWEEDATIHLPAKFVDGITANHCYHCDQSTMSSLHTIDGSP